MKKKIFVLTVMLLSTILLIGTTTPAFASTQSKKYKGDKVQRWKPIAIAAANHYHVYSSFIVTKSLWISAGENGGGEHSKAGRACVGLFQFNSGWRKSSFGKKFRAPMAAHTVGGHVVMIDPLKGWVPGNLKWKKHPKDWRRCGTCSMYRFMKVYHDGGLSAVKSHWRATYY